MSYIDRSKKNVFKNECGICGKPLRRNSRNKIGYLCNTCGPRQVYNENGVCHYCPFEMNCTMRVQLGIWIRCETPDIADLERLKFTGGLDDERVRKAVDEALVFRGCRKVLEEAIEQSAPKIYQGSIKGRQRKISVGIRDNL